MRKTAIILMLGASLAGCTSAREKRLRAEIGQIEGRIGTVENEIEQGTAAIGTQQEGLRARAAYRPIQAWGEKISAAPPAERTVTYRQTSRHGRIVRRRINNPWPLPDGEWYVEIDNATATRAKLVIGRLDFQPGPNGLSLTTPLDFDIESRIHAHFDPGPGGGIGTNIFIDGDKRFDAVFRASFLPVTDGKLPYRIDLVSPSSLKITITAHLGGIGNYGHPFEMKNLARELAEGSLDLLFDQAGRIGPLPDGQSFTYRLATGNPVMTSDSGGITLSFDVTAEVVPGTAPLQENLVLLPARADRATGAPGELRRPVSMK